MIIIRNPARTRPLSNNVKRLMRESRASPQNPDVVKSGRTLGEKDMAFCDLQGCIADNIGYYTDDDNKLRGNKYGGACFAGCRAGLTSIGIDSVGNVRGCESMYDDSFIEGNLRDKALKEIWESLDAFAYNRRFVKTLLTGKCQTCPKGPYCAGGCRSYNYFVHGKLYETPLCARGYVEG